MRKNSQYISISEYCKVNGLHTTKFYETLSGHPELAKKLKTNAKGERVLDEKAITAAGAILRKENMIYYRKNTDSEMPLPEDFDILFFGESGGRRKSKKTIKLIAVISAVCAAVAGTIFIIRHNAKKPKV